MQFKKVYFPVNAIPDRKDFDIWYEDGEVLYHVQSDWAGPKSSVEFMGRFGGRSCLLKPDAMQISYYIRLERYEHVLRTYRLYEDYFVEGMHWEISGSLRNLPLSFENDKTHNKDVTVREVEFLDHGPCYEIKVTKHENLRCAAVAVVGIALKEFLVGKSEGIKDKTKPWGKRIRDFFFGGRGYTYEQLQLEDARKEAARRALEEERGRSDS